jgi:hypothetical protein
MSTPAAQPVSPAVQHPWPVRAIPVGLFGDMINNARNKDNHHNFHI